MKLRTARRTLQRQSEGPGHQQEEPQCGWSFAKAAVAVQSPYHW